MIEALLGVLIGLFLGFPLGFVCTEETCDKEIFDKDFTTGFAYGEDSFCNPSAKG